MTLRIVGMTCICVNKDVKTSHPFRTHVSQEQQAKTQRINVIFERYLRGNTSSLIKSSHGAGVLDFASQTILTARQRSELVIELLYSRERKLLDGIRAKLAQNLTFGKVTPVKSLFAKSLTLVDDTFRDVVAESAAASLGQLLDKESLLRFEALHAVVKGYLIVAVESYPKEKAIDMAAQLVPPSVQFAHTKPGIHVAVSCVKLRDAKRRKKVVRRVKTHIRNISVTECGLRLISLPLWLIDSMLPEFDMPNPEVATSR